jgi:hypothetical protein
MKLVQLVLLVSGSPPYAFKYTSGYCIRLLTGGGQTYAICSSVVLDHVALLSDGVIMGVNSVGTSVYNFSPYSFAC